MKQKLTSTKARTSRANIATDITTNADNYAQYVLAKYVQGKIGGYPWLPIADKEAFGEIRPKALLFNDGSNGRGVSSNYKPFLRVRDNLPDTAESKTGVHGLSAENGPDLDWISDDNYPANYIKDLNDWATKDAPNPTAKPTAKPQLQPTSPKIQQKCAGLSPRNPYLNPHSPAISRISAKKPLHNESKIWVPEILVATSTTRPLIKATSQFAGPPETNYPLTKPNVTAASTRS